MDPDKARFAHARGRAPLNDVIWARRVFSAYRRRRAASQDMSGRWRQPLILALANPTRKSCRGCPVVRDDAVLATAAAIIPTSQQCPVFPFTFGVRWMSSPPPLPVKWRSLPSCIASSRARSKRVVAAAYGGIRRPGFLSPNTIPNASTPA